MLARSSRTTRTGFQALASAAMVLCSAAALAQSAATSSSSQAVAGAVGATGSSISQASGSLRATTQLTTTSSATPLPLADGYQTLTASAALTGGAITALQGAASNVSQGAGTGSAQSSGNAHALLPQTLVQGGVQGATQYINIEPDGSVGAGIFLPWAQVSGGATSQAQALLSSGTNGAASLGSGASGTVNHAMNVTLAITNAEVDVAVVTPTNQSQNTVQPTVQSQSGSGQIVLPGGSFAAGAVSNSAAAGDGISFMQAY